MARPVPRHHPSRDYEDLAARLVSTLAPPRGRVEVVNPRAAFQAYFEDLLRQIDSDLITRLACMERPMPRLPHWSSDLESASHLSKVEPSTRDRYQGCSSAR